MAFFLIKSGVNFVAVAVLGTAMALGLGPDLSPWLTAFPAAMAALAIVSVVVISRLGPGAPLDPEAARLRWAVSALRRAVTRGSSEAFQIVRSGDPRVLAGSFGYWAFDNAVLWATFHAFGLSLPLTVILMGYLIGQLGGLLPIPGGIGSVDVGLIGTLIVYGAPAAGTAAAVLAYHVILFWLPLIAGGIAFAAPRRDMPGAGEFASCAPATAGSSRRSRSISRRWQKAPHELASTPTDIAHACRNPEQLRGDLSAETRASASSRQQSGLASPA